MGLCDCHHTSGTRTQSAEPGNRRVFACRSRESVAAAMAQLRWAGDEFFHDSNHVGASPRDSAQRVPDRRVAAFRERLPVVRCDVCSLPHVDPGDLSANASGKMAALFYSGTFMFIAMCCYLFIRAAFRKPLLSATASMEFVAKTCHDYMFGPPLYLVATVSAFLDERVSLAVCKRCGFFRRQR